jgi:protease-4
MVSVLIFVLVAAFVLSIEYYGVWHDEWSGYNASHYISDGTCNIAVVPINGELTTFPYIEEVDGEIVTSGTSMSETVAMLDLAEFIDPNIFGILVLVDSSGGSPSASKLIADALKKNTLPIAAYILDYGVSGGYYVATGADRIFASSYADAGGIGITMSHLNYAKQNEESGIEYISLASGKFKDAGSLDKPFTPEERALFERDLALYHNAFVEDVALNRNLPVEKVAELADGSTLPAPLALQAGLIDAIGGIEDVRVWFSEELNLNTDEIIFCK